MTTLLQTDSDAVDWGRPSSSTGDNRDEDDQTENNKCEVLPFPAAVDIRSMSNSVHRCLKVYLNGEMFEHTDQLEQFVGNKLL
jgi:hypothetical protein